LLKRFSCIVTQVLVIKALQTRFEHAR